MCTDRVCTLALALGIVLGAISTVHADETAARDWWKSTSRVCLWVVVDGMRASALEGAAPWDGPLMPLVAARRDDCLRFDNVWAELDDDTGSLAQLIAGVSPIAAMTESDALPLPPEMESTELRRTRGIQPTLAALDEAARSEGRWLVLASLDDLQFPLRLNVETLRALDPRPWIDAPQTRVEIEWVEDKRLRQAIEVATQAHPLRSRMSDHSLEIYRWVVEAAHRELDARLEQLLQRMDRPDLIARGGWILSAPRALAFDRHGLDQPGTGAVVDRLHVPLWWRLPKEVDLRGRRDEARTTRDLARTLLAFDRGEAVAALFGPSQDERFAFVSGQRQVGRTSRPWAQLRWATPEFTVLDLVSSPRRMEIFDRRLDPQELHPRGAASQALWDSLRTEVSGRMLGTKSTLECVGAFAAAQVTELFLAASPAEIELLGGSGVELRAAGGGTRLRWAPPAGDSQSLRLSLPSEKASLRLSATGVGSDRVQLGGRSVPLSANESLEVTVGSRLFVDMLESAPRRSSGLRLRWIVEGWWTTP